jgi:hypothetical protein
MSDTRNLVLSLAIFLIAVCGVLSGVYWIIHYLTGSVVLSVLVAIGELIFGFVLGLVIVRFLYRTGFVK